MRGGAREPVRVAVAAGLLCWLALLPLEAAAQQGKPKVPPQLPPQAAEKAKETVQAHTAPTVNLTAPAAGALYTAPATVPLEAAAGASSSGKSIEKVEFFAGETIIGIATVAPYSFTWTNVVAGSYSLSARATDNLGVASTSGAVAIIVNAPPTVTLASPANDALFTAPAAITLRADAQDSDGAIAQVEFFQGTSRIATLTSAPYTFELTGVAAGSYSFSVKATDNRGATAMSAPVTVRVNAPPSVNITSPLNDATFTAPATIALTAEAADADGSITRVQFYNGTSLIATVTSSPYGINWTQVPAGSYSLTARVTDNLGATTTSSAISVTVTQALAQIYYIHTDHLNTPRAIYDQSQRLVWRWDNLDPFGGNAPDENPSGLGTFTCNLRFPGQYFDRETNLYYNYFRNYDPAIGRYIQSDPIGLRGGLNTYTYVESRPLSYTDPFGLDRTFWRGGPGRWTMIDGPRNGNWCGGDWSGGQVPSRHGGKDGIAPPLDSLDRCCMVHDRCYSKCEKLEKSLHKNCLIQCDRDIVFCLRGLDDDCTKWPERPRAGTEGDSQMYRDDAMRHFTEEIKKWERKNSQRP